MSRLNAEFAPPHPGCGRGKIRTNLNFCSPSPSIALSLHVHCRIFLSSMMMQTIRAILSPSGKKSISSLESPSSSPITGCSPPLLAANDDAAGEAHPNNIDAPAPITRVPHKTWFRLLQDEGKAMAPAEFASFAENSRKTKTRTLHLVAIFTEIFISWLKKYMM